MNDIKKILFWLHYLFYDLGNQSYDFDLQILERDGIKTKRKKFSQICFDYEDSWNRWFLSKCNQRGQLPFEVILDCEDKNKLPQIIKELGELKIKFYPFSTSSRGFHCHIFFNRELSELEKLKIIKHFDGDIQLASNKHMIALEFAEHWKSKKPKELIEWK